VKKERVEHEPIMVSRDIGGAALSGAFSGAQALRMAWLDRWGSDPAEKKDVAKDHPDVVRKIVQIMNSRTPSEFDKWNFPRCPTM